MLVANRMSHPVLTIHPDVPVQEALVRMRKDKVRRYPVVSERGKLLGIVTESDLMNASPSEATTLSVWEVGYLLSKINVDRVMTRDVITADPNMPIEEAASIMASRKVGSLPVVDNGKLVGIITETDIFNVFIEVLGARTNGLRLTAEIKDEPGRLYDLTGAVQKAGGNIIGLGAIQGDSSESRALTMKINGTDIDSLRAAVEPIVERIIDLREVRGSY